MQFRASRQINTVVPAVAAGIGHCFALTSYEMPFSQGRAACFLCTE